MSLLDQTIPSYVIKWEGLEGMGFKLNAEIQKENEEHLGHIESKGLVTRKTYLYDADKKEIFNTTKSKWSLGAKYDVKNPNNEKFYEVSQKALSRQKIIFLKNSNGNEILKFQGSNNLGDIQEIYSMDGKLVAVFSRKQDIVKKSRWKGKFYNKSIFKIHDLDFDRKALWAMYIGCLSSFLDYTKSEMQENIDTFKK